MKVYIPNSLYYYLYSQMVVDYIDDKEPIIFQGYAGEIKLYKFNEMEEPSIEEAQVSIISEIITGGYKYCLTKEITNEQVTRSEGSKRKRTSKKRNPEGVESGASRNIQRKA